MPLIVAKDPRGNSIRVHEYRGKRFPAAPFHDLDISLANLPDLPCRDDDVTIVTYPKAGTHWTWEIANMLLTGESGLTSRDKESSMIDIQPTDGINNLPSRRILNTHITPDMFPKQLVEKKTKIIYVTRNPKDILVSFYHHVKKIKIYEYSQGDWDSFFELMMFGGGVDYGSWFEFTKQWDKFIRDHPDVPVLTLNYEDLKQNTVAGVEKMANFLGVTCKETTIQNIVEKCSFGSMKQEKGKITEMMRHVVVGDEHPMYRKGIVGDWKTHFTVAQNEIFNEEYKKQMSGYSFDFEKYM